MFTNQPNSWHIATRVYVSCWQVWWDLTLTNQSYRYWWILIPFFVIQLIWPTLSPLWIPWEPWTEQMVVIWTGRNDPDISWTDFERVSRSRHPSNLWKLPSLQPGGRSLLLPLSPFLISLPWGIDLDCWGLGWVSTDCWVLVPVSGVPSFWCSLSPTGRSSGSWEICYRLDKTQVTDKGNIFHIF